jgi:hypothetical protein
MKHQATRDLYAYWQQLRRGRIAPDRAEIEPADIRHLLGHTFILEVVSRREYRFRLAGTRICALYGREMKGKDFAEFWVGKDREAIATMLSAITEDAAATVMGLVGKTDHGRELALEALMLPLKQRNEGYTRILGSLVPMDDPFWIGIHPVMSQTVASLRLIWPDEKPTGLVHSGQIPPIHVPLSAVEANSQVDRAETVPVFQTGNVVAANFRRRVQHLTVYDGGKD